MNTLSKYSLKTQINLIFALTSLHNFIKNYLLEDTNYFEAENKDAIIQSSRSNNLFLGNSLVTSICMNKKRDVITDTIQVDYTLYFIQRGFVTQKYLFY